MFKNRPLLPLYNNGWLEVSERLPRRIPFLAGHRIRAWVLLRIISAHSSPAQPDTPGF